MAGSTSGSQDDIAKVLEDEMRASLVNGKLPCAVAFQIAKKLKISPKQVGRCGEQAEHKNRQLPVGLFPIMGSAEGQSAIGGCWGLGGLS